MVIQDTHAIVNHTNLNTFVSILLFIKEFFSVERFRININKGVHANSVSCHIMCLPDLLVDETLLLLAVLRA